MRFKVDNNRKEENLTEGIKSCSNNVIKTLSRNQIKIIKKSRLCNFDEGFVRDIKLSFISCMLSTPVVQWISFSNGY